MWKFLLIIGIIATICHAQQYVLQELPPLTEQAAYKQAYSNADFRDMYDKDVKAMPASTAIGLNALSAGDPVQVDDLDLESSEYDDKPMVDISVPGNEALSDSQTTTVVFK